MGGWIGVDLDGTLAEYAVWSGAATIGNPITPMVERVKKWLAEGMEVRIFTARVCRHGSTPEEVTANREAVVGLIGAWCEQHIGKRLPVTNEKDFGMIELWDDRCVRVRPNTGMPCCESWFKEE